jgi:exodeoxyribonuclease-3
MKIASFNINDINRRFSNLLSWVREAQPDIICPQELKAADTQFPAEAIRLAGYHAVCRGETRWNGVAILAVARGRASHGLARCRRRSAMPHRGEWIEFGQ